MRTLLVFLFLATQAFGAFSYYRTLTVDHTKCGSSDSSNFPVLVSISHSTLKTVANGGHVQHTATQSAPMVTMPADLIFSADSSGSTKYPWEVESYDGTNGLLTAWVKIPSVSHTADTPFYMLYGDAAIGAAQNIGSYAPANVWSENFRMVLHLNGSSPSVIDSTGSTSPLNTGITATTGQVDGAGYSSGSTNKITVATNLYTLIGGSTTNTVSFWANPTTFANAPVALTWGDGFIEFAPGNGAYWVSGGLRVYSSVASPGSWQYISLVKSGSGDSGTLYRNASPLTVDSGALAGDPTNAGSTILFNFSDTTYAYSGALDEVRVASTSRTADWILTEYNNQNAPGNVGADNFLHFSAEGTTPPPPASGVRHNVIGGE